MAKDVRRNPILWPAETPIPVFVGWTDGGRRLISATVTFNAGATEAMVRRLAERLIEIASLPDLDEEEPALGEPE